ALRSQHCDSSVFSGNVNRASATGSRVEAGPRVAPKTEPAMVAPAGERPALCFDLDVSLDGLRGIQGAVSEWSSCPFCPFQMRMMPACPPPMTRPSFRVMATEYR